MNKLRWELVIALAGLGLIAFLLLTGPRVSPPATEATPSPAVGGVYTEAIVGRPARLNPLLDSLNSVDRDLGRLIFSGLIKFDSAGRPQGDLAESWAVGQDGLTYTFSLRPNLRWHDGEPLTAEDVLFTVQLLQDPGYPGPADVREFWKGIQTSKLSDVTVQFTLPEPYAPFLDQLSIGLLPKHLLEGVDAKRLPALDFNLRPTGSGPFVLERLTTDGVNITGAILTPFAEPYGPEPLLAGLRFCFFSTEAEALAAYRAGQVDGISRLTGEALQQALADASFNIYTSREPRLTLMYLNLNNTDLPFFQDKQVRQALLAGLNRRRMVDTLLGGQAIVADSPILPGSWAYNDSLPQVVYDPERAADLLDAAGWTLPAGVSPGDPAYLRSKDGRELSWTILVPDDPLHIALAEAAQQDWIKLGVKTGVKAIPTAELLKDYLQPRAFEAALVDINLSRYPDPDPYVFWHQTQAETGQNYGQLNERSISESLELARLTQRLEDRAKLYRTFQSRFAGQTPALLFFYPVYDYAVNSKVAGISLGPLVDPADRFDTLAGWHIK